MEKLGQKLPPLKKRKLSKKVLKEEEGINRRLAEANQMCNDWKCQIYLNKHEWFNTRSRYKRNK